MDNFSLLLILINCKGKKNESYFTTEKASVYFKEIEQICNRDSGKLWGKNLYGPIMFVERVTRRITSNLPDNEGLLKYKDGVYTGLYPKELILSNAPVKFGGTQFAMTPLPEEEEMYRIKTRAIHSLFHRFRKMKELLLLPLMKIIWMKRGQALDQTGMESITESNKYPRR